MKTRVGRLLFWTPRILCILFAAFISIFAADVVGQGYGFWKTAQALLIHLIPTWIILVVLVAAWRWEWIGAVAFAGLAAFYLAISWGRFHWSVYLIIAGPLFLVGILFFLNWVYRRQIRSGAGPRRL